MITSLARNAVLEQNPVKLGSEMEIGKIMNPKSIYLAPEPRDLTLESSLAISSMVPDSDSRCRWQSWKQREYGKGIDDPEREYSKAKLPDMGPRYLVLAKNNKVHKDKASVSGKGHSCKVG